MNCCCNEYIDSLKPLEESFKNNSFAIYGNINKGQDIIIKYHGKLVIGNACNITISLGYGNLWECKETLIMKKCEHSDNNVFCMKVTLKNYNVLNFCFMDDTNTWDLNDNSSYNLNIEEKFDTVTKAVDLMIPDDELKNPFTRFFTHITNTILNFFLRVGDVFEKENLK